METLPVFSSEPFARPARGPRAAGRASKPLRVVVVDEELPYPATSGKRIRTLNLILRLAWRHHLTYVCHRNADPDEARAAEAYFRSQGITTVVVNRAVPPKSGPRFYARLAANLLSPLPYSVASHTSAALRQALRDHAARHPVDLWHCEWTPYAEALRAVPGGRRLVMAHNVESLIWQRYAEAEPNPLKRWYIRKQWRKFESFERRAFAEADRTVAVSGDDAALVRRFGGRAVDVVDNGVDTGYFQPAGEAREAGRILFLGSLDWRPNLDAAALLLDQVFPEVRRREPAARLALVGRNPPVWLRQRAAQEAGVELHADVPDVRPHLHQSGVLAVPLRIGGGSRLKILEALACGLPVVATRVGAEGLCLVPDKHLVVVPGPADMAAALVRCIREPGWAQALAGQGRRVVLDYYDWDALADKLERVWLDVVCGSGFGS